jgi:hypothetical protein
MSYDFKKLMAEKSDVDLLKVLAGGADEYTPGALKAAEEEFAKRNISEATLSNAKNIYADYKVRESAKEQAVQDRVSVFFWLKMGGLILVIVIGVIVTLLKSCH